MRGPLNNGPLQAESLETVICSKEWSATGDGQPKTVVRLWQRFASGDGLLMAVVCFGRWSASDNSPLMAVVCLLTRSAYGSGSLQAMVHLRQWSLKSVVNSRTIVRF